MEEAGRLEVPPLDELYELGIVVEQSKEPPWPVTLTAWASDGDEVTLIWTETPAGVDLTWMSGDTLRLSLCRDGVHKIWVRKSGGTITISVRSWYREGGGGVAITIGERVTVADQLLTGDGRW